jgi:hypothetical protein
MKPLAKNQPALKGNKKAGQPVGIRLPCRVNFAGN